MNAYAIPALTKKRNEIASEIEALQDRLRIMARDLEALDVTIRLFDPEYPAQVLAATRSKKDAYKDRRPIARHVLEVLQHVSEPLSDREIAERLPETFGSKNRKLTLRVRRALYNLRNRGIVRSQRFGKTDVRWEIS